MATVLDLITDALQEIGVLAEGETATSADANLALRQLNRMLGLWNADTLYAVAETRTPFTLTPSLNPHTIGSAGSFNTTRPVKLQRAGIMQGTSETELEVLRSREEYQQIVDKTNSGLPTKLFYEGEYPLGKVFLWPVPSTASSLILYLRGVLASVTLATTIAYPPGYEEAILYNLCVRMAKPFGTQVDAATAALAMEGKAIIQAANIVPMYMKCDDALVGSGGYNILAGELK